MNIQSSVVQEVLQRRWEPRRWGESWPAIGRWQGPIERIIKADDPHNYTLSCRRTRHHHSAVFWHLKQIGEVEKLLSVDLMNWLQIQKKSLFWSVVFSYPLQQQWTISWLDCDVRLQVDFIHQPATNDQISGWSKKKFPSISQSQTCTKKRSRSLFSGLLPVWSSTVFWILAKPLHQRSMLSKLMRSTKNCSVCSHLWSTERAQFFAVTTPTTPHTTNGSQL